ncbi:hypothetical protein A2335_03060 [Candidatus Peregrinibacteria bacterium RIFOXYB2_FULL_32_7]|nr:MAG: hypothetical protein A2335_03060 [Candidatus Peregrinibacteria bacterium RIFOXYB2_FULL_32_7]
MIKRIIIGLLVNMGALYIVIEILNGVDFTGGIYFFLLTGVIIGLLNNILKPILKLLSLPFILISMGLFLVIINSFILYFVDYMLEILDFANIDLIVTDRLDYLLAAIIFGIANWIERFLLKF